MLRLSLALDPELKYTNIQWLSSCLAWARICGLSTVIMQVAEAQARLEHNKQYIAFLQHQIDIKVARAARQKSQEDEVRPALFLP